MTSRLPGFHALPVEERRRVVAEGAGLGGEDVAALASGGLSLADADLMVENVVGLLAIPVGVATNFVVDGVERLVPMAVEEASVIAAASKAALLARARGGFRTEVGEGLMIGQIQVVGAPDPYAAAGAVAAAEQELLALANACDPRLVEAGGGARRVETRLVETGEETFLVLHLLVDCRDAMGANAVNTMAEGIAPEVERATRGRVVLRIISNLADRRLVTARAVFELGEAEAEGVLAAYRFALHDPYRAATNNKGVMNGVASVALATGNDTRAVEAGGHAYAATASRVGHYSSLTHFARHEAGVAGELTLPLAVGTVGGATVAHPAARACLRILGATGWRELAGAMAAVGLAQQFAAMLALATTGIQAGHMRLHARKAQARGVTLDVEAVRALAPERLYALDGRVAIVTGAAGGLGQWLAAGLGAAGARVLLTDLHETGLAETEAALAAAGIETASLAADLVAAETPERLVAAARERLGGLDVLVNNAGVNRREPIVEVERATFDWILDVDLRVPYFLAQAAARALIAEGRGGSIVNVCSLNSFYGLGGVSVYGAAKGALAQLTRTMAVEWAPHGIRANGLAPGFMATPLSAPVWADPDRVRWFRNRIPLKRPGQPAELVGLLLLLASDAGSYITGQTFLVDGGVLAGGSWYTPDE